jgi:hypothetical protein
MPSTINSNNINVLYPIAGQDNDTQGFRDNFRNIKNNLTTASQEITALQSNVDLTPKIAYAGGITSANVTYPASATAPGAKGQITWGPNPLAPTYLYVCIATDTWVRANVATW